MNNYVNEYVTYLKNETGDSGLVGTLITLKELKSLGCTINDDYTYSEGVSCNTSSYKSWLVNGQYYWTRSDFANTNQYRVWIVYSDGSLHYYYSLGAGIRPVITISKEAL